MRNPEQNNTKRKAYISKSLQKVRTYPKEIHNIFETVDPSVQQSLDAISSQSPYHFIGDSDFRLKMIRDQRRQLPQIHNNTSQFIDLPEVTVRKSILDVTHLTLRDTSRLIQKPELNYIGRLNKTRKALQGVEYVVMKYQQDWSSFDIKIQAKLRRPKKQLDRIRLFIENNPEKQELIKQTGCQFWKKSLRNNDKRLLKHIQGAPHSRNQVLKMLQTVKGLKKLEEQIPKPQLRNLKQGFSVEGTQFQKRSFSLNGISPFNAQQIYQTAWKNRDLSRLYHQF